MQEAHLLGFTDTDDVAVAERQGESIAGELFPHDAVVLIPNSVGLVDGGRHRAAAEKLMDFILSEEVEAMLAASPSRQIPLRDAVAVPDGVTRLRDLKLLTTDYAKGADLLPRALQIAKEELR